MTESSETSAKTYSLAEIAKHNSNASSWLIIHNNIYDVTAFLNEVRIANVFSIASILKLYEREEEKNYNR